MPYPIGFRVCFPIATGLLPETGIIVRTSGKGAHAEILMAGRHDDQMAAMDAIGPKPELPLWRSNGDKQTFVHGDCQRQPSTLCGSSPDHRLVPRKTVVMVPRPWHSADASC
jgi:hypothetical protein